MSYRIYGKTQGDVNGGDGPFIRMQREEEGLHCTSFLWTFNYFVL